MIPVVFDMETHLIKCGMNAPRLVCMSVALPDGSTSLMGRDEALDTLEMLLDEHCPITNQNIFFDLKVGAVERPTLLPKIFDAFERGDIHDNIIRQKMIDNSDGSLKFVWDDVKGEWKKQRPYFLADLVKQHLKIDISSSKQGDDVWRMRYNELDGIPISQYPKEAYEYPIMDSVYAQKIWQSQEKLAVSARLNEPAGQVFQARAAWALDLMSSWGPRTDAAMVAEYKKELTTAYEKEVEICKEHGFRRGNGTRDTKKIQEAIEKWYREADRQMRLTPKGAVSTDREQLTNTDHPGLLAVAESVKIEKNLSTYIPALERGTEHPLNPNYNPIIESFRTSCSSGKRIDGVFPGMNIQNLPRAGTLRKCFVPREGMVYAFCDYDTLEMRTLAQICLDLFGESCLADALRQGEDPHLSMAASMLSMPYSQALDLYNHNDPAIGEARQFCFHPDTEALTPNGWKKIGDLSKSDYVAAAIPENGDIRIEWQRPTALTRRPATELVHLQCEGMDLRVTKDHRMLAIRGSDGSPEVTTPLEMPKKRGWWNAGKAPGGEWDPDEKLLRLAVATQADGSFNGHQIFFGFTKSRKIERMRRLLEGVPHKESVTKHGVTQFAVFGKNDYPSGRHTTAGIADEIRDMLSDKQFDERWLRLSSNARQTVLDEAQHWDARCSGQSVSYQYLNMNKSSVEILQIIATLEGRKTRLVQEKPSGIWALTVRNHPSRKNDRSRGDNLKADVIPHDGDVVCLSVPSTFVLVRDGGIPVITGQCKIGNYGFGGGMGADSFVSYAKGYGIVVSPQKAQELHGGYRRRWTETVKYFNFVSNLCAGGRADQIVVGRTGLVRGKVGYTQGCNHHFQHLAAIGAKEALIRVSRECYVDAGSPLFGCRPWYFGHDEIGMEIPEKAFGPRRTHDAAMRLQTVMVEAMQAWVPDVPIGATVAMARRWLKGAKPVLHRGLLVPSKKVGDEWVADVG